MAELLPGEPTVELLPGDEEQEEQRGIQVDPELAAGNAAAMAVLRPEVAPQVQREAEEEMAQGNVPSILPDLLAEAEDLELEETESAIDIIMRDTSQPGEVSLGAVDRIINEGVIPNKRTMDARVAETMQLKRKIERVSPEQDAIRKEFAEVAPWVQAEAFSTINDLTNKFAASLDSGTLGSLKDVAEIVVDPTNSAKIAHILSPFAGDQAGTVFNIYDIVVAAKKNFRDAKPHDKVIMVQRMLELISENNGLFQNTNDLEKFFLLKTLVNDRILSDSEIESEAFMEAVFAGLDVLTLGVGVSDVFRLGRFVGEGASLYSNLTKLTLLDPKTAQELSALALSHDKRAQELLHTDATEVAISTLLPKFGFTQPASINLASRLATTLEDEPEALRQILSVLETEGRVLTEAERAEAVARTQRLLDRDVRSGVIHPDKTAAVKPREINDDTVTVRAVIGKDADNGFSAEEALEFLKNSPEVKGENARKVTVMMRNHETGELEAIPVSRAIKILEDSTHNVNVLEPLKTGGKHTTLEVVVEEVDNVALFDQIQNVVRKVSTALKKNRGIKGNMEVLTKLLRKTGVEDEIIDDILKALEKTDFEKIPDALYVALAMTVKAKSVNKSRVERGIDVVAEKRTGMRPIAVSGKHLTEIADGKIPKGLDKQAVEVVLGDLEDLAAARAASEADSMEDLRAMARLLGLNSFGKKKSELVEMVSKEANALDEEGILQFIGREHFGVEDGMAVLDPGNMPELILNTFENVINWIETTYKIDYGKLTLTKKREIVKDYLDSIHRLVRRPIDTSRQDEFFIGVERTHEFNMKDIIARKERDITGFGGLVAKYLPGASQFAKWIVVAGANAERRAAVLEQSFGRMLVPFSDLGAKKKREVSAVLDMGDREGKWFKPQELRGMGWDDEMVRAYSKVQQFNETLYLLNNRRLRQELVGKGYKHMRVGQFEGMVRSISDSEAARATHAFDPVTGQIVQVDNLPHGYRLVKSRWEIRSKREKVGADGVNYDVTPYVLNRGEVLGDLPEMVLRRRPGYITRGYQAGYIVTKTVRVMEPDGKVKERTVVERIAGNLAEADDYIAAHGGKEAGLDRHLAQEARDVEYVNGESLDFYNDNGMLFFSARREEELLNTRGERAIHSITDSLDRAVRAASRQVGMGSYIASEKIRWVRTYGNMLANDGKTFKEFPRPDEVVGKRFASKTDQMKWDEAIAKFERIRMLERHDDSLSARAWNRTMRWLSDEIGMSGEGMYARARNWISVKALEQTTFKPIEWAKHMTFNALIVANPITQVFLQMHAATVYMGVDGGFKFYTTLGKNGLSSQITALAAGVGARTTDHWDKIKRVAAKTLDMTPSQYERWVDDFVDSGLMQSIDSHEFLNAFGRGDFKTGRNLHGTGGMAETLLNAGRSATITPAEKIFHGAKKVGFQAGETTNLMAAWLTARRRWEGDERFKGTAGRADIEAIAGDAGNLALNMSAGDRLAFQKGFLSLALQFFSIQLKTTQVLLRAVPFVRHTGLANKTFSTWEATKIAFMQSMLYGTAGLGVRELVWEPFRDTFLGPIDPAVDEAVSGGLMDVAFNKALGAMTGSDTDLEWSSRFAPVSGPASVFENLTKGFSLILDSPESMAEILAGASWTVGSRIKNFADTGQIILGRVDLPAGEKLARMIPLLLDTISSGYSNAAKARLAVKFGQIQSSGGQPVVSASFGEAIGKIFGVQTGAEKDVNDIYFDTVGMGRDSDAEKSELDETARTLYNNSLKLAVRFANGDLDHEMFNNLLAAHHIVLKLSYSPEQRFYIMESMKNRHAKQDLTKSRGIKLAELIAEGYVKSGWLGSIEQLRNRIANSDIREGKQEILDLLDRIGTEQISEEDLRGYVYN